MKNSIIKAVGLFFVLAILACTKDETAAEDFTNPANLVGTTWKSGGFPNTNVEYALLEFLAANRVQGSSKRENQELELDWNGVFNIENDSISIIYDIEEIKGKINGSTMVFQTEDGVEIRFDLN
ncbi:hypothetical protein [uncultured Croceitalea sp.]|uniref:hypothetical protein n=1 Tax=uncultured Croceitalea sp. TaxID=1798908 RepID=UPI003306463B